MEAARTSLFPDRFRPQRLPGHKDWLIWDDQEKRHVTEEGGMRLMKLPTQGKALAAAIRLARAAGVPNA